MKQATDDQTRLLLARLTYEYYQRLCAGEPINPDDEDSDYLLTPHVQTFWVLNGDKNCITRYVTTQVETSGTDSFFTGWLELYDRPNVSLATSDKLYTSIEAAYAVMLKPLRKQVQDTIKHADWLAARSPEEASRLGTDMVQMIDETLETAQREAARFGLVAEYTTIRQRREQMQKHVSTI